MISYCAMLPIIILLVFIPPIGFLIIFLLMYLRFKAIGKWRENLSLIKKPIPFKRLICFEILGILFLIVIFLFYANSLQYFLINTQELYGDFVKILSSSLIYNFALFLYFAISFRYKFNIFWDMKIPTISKFINPRMCYIYEFIFFFSLASFSFLIGMINTTLIHGDIWTISIFFISTLFIFGAIRFCYLWHLRKTIDRAEDNQYNLSSNTQC